MPVDAYKITHCLFDMDGLLLDTEYLYTKAFNRTINCYGKEFTWEHKAHVMGFKSNDIADYIIEELDLPLTPEEFKQEINEICQELFPRTKPMPERYWKMNEKTKLKKTMKLKYTMYKSIFTYSSFRNSVTEIKSTTKLRKKKMLSHR
ncbi:hypothetical protein ACFW04_003802 [Cataglyphis niger]